MDAIMAVLAATILANADGRYARLLAALVDGRPTDRRTTVIVFFTTFTLLAIVSAIGAILAGAQLGPGVLNLFAAFALGWAAVAVLWRRGTLGDGADLAGAATPMLFVRLLLLQLGDRNQFLIFALGALSGAAAWGIAGGAAGLLVAMLPVLGWGPVLLDTRWAGRLRWAAAFILLIWAAIHLRRAFGV